MASRKKDDGLKTAQVTMEAIRALVQLTVIIISAARACTLLAPTELNSVVGAQTYSGDSNLIAWYCQETSGDLFDCTSDEYELVATELPQIAGIGSMRDGTLVILFNYEGAYWIGDVTGPQALYAYHPDGQRVVDIATNGDGEIVQSLCVGHGPPSDCLTDGGIVYDYLQEDQRFVAITWHDDSGKDPKLWCASKGETVDCLEIDD